jgi:hypothetical protein
VLTDVFGSKVTESSKGEINSGPKIPKVISNEDPFLEY